MDALDSLAARDAILRSVRALIASDTRVAQAFRALSRTAMARSEVEAELALAFVCCMWETSRGMPDRFPAVCEGLASGMSMEQLFPTSIRDSRRSKRSYAPRGGNATG